MDSFRKNILQFNSQLSRDGLESFNLEKLRGSRPDSLIIFGMGGSGLAGDILKAVKEEIGLKLPIIIWKNYGLPFYSRGRIRTRPVASLLCFGVAGARRAEARYSHAFKNPLYVFVSFSGNTEETLSGIKMLLKSRRKRNVAAIATGGELKNIALKNSLPFISFPARDLTPRQAVGRMFYGLVKILEAAGFRLKVKDFTKINPAKFESSGKSLSQKLKNRLIVIYADQKHNELGYIWKIKFNETAKMPAFNNVLPEMNHNEIVSFTKNRFPTAAIFLLDKTNPRIQKRFFLTEKLLKQNGVLTIPLRLGGKSRLEKTWNTIILADWTTYFLAKLNRVDPAKTEIIAQLKKLMK